MGRRELRGEASALPSPLAALSPELRGRVRPSPAPQRPEPMKASLSRERFSDPAWMFERKLDGIRCHAVRAGQAVSLRSRNDLSLNARYPELAAALEQQEHAEFAIDAEVVAFEGSRTSFARLAQRGHHWVPVWLYVFDLVWVSGYDVRGLPLRVRKSLLRTTLSFDRPLRFTAHRNRDGDAYFDDACRRGWEGLIAKRMDSPYRPGRSRDWLKFKCEQGQELVIGGFTAPRGSREEFGALLLGYYSGGELRYAGKVGTGFDRATLHALAARLRRLRRRTAPFASVPREATRATTWVEPELVAQVSFTEWTGDGRLRHPRFLGLREDKSAHEVVREDLP